MTILLDTGVFIWTLSGDQRLPSHVVERMEQGRDAVLFSQVSLIEMQIKIGLGKLRLPLALDEVPTYAATIGIEQASLTNAAIFAVDRFPTLHRDPFDRLLMGHAVSLDAEFCTPDAMARRYPVRIFW